MILFFCSQIDSNHAVDRYARHADLYVTHHFYYSSKSTTVDFHSTHEKSPVSTYRTYYGYKYYSGTSLTNY